MQQVPPTKLAENVLAVLRESLEAIEPLAIGSTSTVWRIKSNGPSYALRLINDSDRVLSGQIDMFLRKELSTRGGHVAEPVLSSETRPDIAAQTRWSLDRLVTGIHPERGHLSERVCRDLGQTLAALHTIPVRNHGRPSHLDQETVVGKTNTSLDGVKQRFDHPLPDTWDDGFMHPVLVAAPELESGILAKLKDVTAALGAGQAVLCHSDLHERQMLCAGDALNALIDFGDATILDRHWDFGSVLYFHGRANFEMICERYKEASGWSEGSFDLIEAFSIAIAMHHGSRSVLPGKHHRLVRAINYIRNLVSR